MSKAQYSNSAPAGERKRPRSDAEGGLPRGQPSRHAPQKTTSTGTSPIKYTSFIPLAIGYGIWCSETGTTHCKWSGGQGGRLETVYHLETWEKRKLIALGVLLEKVPTPRHLAAAKREGLLLFAQDEKKKEKEMKLDVIGELSLMGCEFLTVALFYLGHANTASEVPHSEQQTPRLDVALAIRLHFTMRNNESFQGVQYNEKFRWYQLNRIKPKYPVCCSVYRCDDVVVLPWVEQDDYGDGFGLRRCFAPGDAYHPCCRMQEHNEYDHFLESFTVACLPDILFQWKQLRYDFSMCGISKAMMTNLMSNKETDVAAYFLRNPSSPLAECLEPEKAIEYSVACGAWRSYRYLCAKHGVSVPPPLRVVGLRAAIRGNDINLVESRLALMSQEVIQGLFGHPQRWLTSLLDDFDLVREVGPNTVALLIATLVRYGYDKATPANYDDSHQLPQRVNLFLTRVLYSENVGLTLHILKAPFTTYCIDTVRYCLCERCHPSVREFVLSDPRIHTLPKHFAGNSQSTVRSDLENCAQFCSVEDMKRLLTAPWIQGWPDNDDEFERVLVGACKREDCDASMLAYLLSLEKLTQRFASIVQEDCVQGEESSEPNPSCAPISQTDQRLRIWNVLNEALANSFGEALQLLLSTFSAPKKVVDYSSSWSVFANLCGTRPADYIPVLLADGRFDFANCDGKGTTVFHILPVFNAPLVEYLLAHVPFTTEQLNREDCNGYTVIDSAVETVRTLVSQRSTGIGKSMITKERTTNICSKLFKFCCETTGSTERCAMKMVRSYKNFCWRKKNKMHGVAYFVQVVHLMRGGASV